jgi:cytochrome b
MIGFDLAILANRLFAGIRGVQNSRISFRRKQAEILELLRDGVCDERMGATRTRTSHAAAQIGQ